MKDEKYLQIEFLLKMRNSSQLNFKSSSLSNFLIYLNLVKLNGLKSYAT